MRRAVEVLVAAALLVAALPVLLLVALRVALDRSGPVLHREWRLGQHGRPFRILKFRTLRAGCATEPLVAVGADPRLTRPGRWLRRLHLDELPQLVLVLRGTMALVGPRPYAAGNLAALDPATRTRLLAHRPGVTGPAAVVFCGEDEVLAEVADPAAAYREVLVPAKAACDLAALAERSVAGDLQWLWRTLRCLVSPRRRAAGRARAAACLAAAPRRPAG